MDLNAMTSCILESETNKDFREYGLNNVLQKKKKEKKKAKDGENNVQN